MSVSVESYSVEPGSPTISFYALIVIYSLFQTTIIFFHKQKTSSCASAFPSTWHMFSCSPLLFILRSSSTLFDKVQLTFPYESCCQDFISYVPLSLHLCHCIQVFAFAYLPSKTMSYMRKRIRFPSSLYSQVQFTF